MFSFNLLIVHGGTQRLYSAVRLSPCPIKDSKNWTHSPRHDRRRFGSCRRMDVRNKLAANLRRLRKERGWSQEALADAANLDRTYVSGLERIVRNPTVTVVERVVTALKCRMGDLLD